MSNQVGGDLIGNAWWSGVLVRDLLADGRRPRRRGRRAPDLGGRLDLRHPAVGAHRRPQCDAGRRHERRAAADRPRLPGAHDRPGALRLRVGVQVGRRHGGHQVRGHHGVLDRPGLGRAGAGQDRVADRRTGVRRRGRRPETCGSAASPGRSRPASTASRSRSTAGTGKPAQLGRVPNEDTWVQWALTVDVEPGRPHAAGARDRPGRRGADRRRARRASPTAPPAGTRSTSRPTDDDG